MDQLFTLSSLAALATLTALEIILGVDNIVFLTIITGKLPESERPRARTIGMALAMGMRIALLLTINWVVHLTSNLFTILGHSVTGKDLVLLGGGLFLIAKATHEIYEKIEAHSEPDLPKCAKRRRKFWAIIAQIILIDVVFSLDSVITAVGMAQSIVIMVAAVVIAVCIMMKFAGTVGAFVERHPSLKMLALAFLVLIGVMLVGEGCGQHINKGYIYFAMIFSLGVEAINIRAGKKVVA